MPWLVATEAFPHCARAAAVAFVGAAHWSYAWACRGVPVGGWGVGGGGVAAFGAFGLVCAVGVSLVAPRRRRCRRGGLVGGVLEVLLGEVAAGEPARGSRL